MYFAHLITVAIIGILWHTTRNAAYTAHAHVYTHTHTHSLYYHYYDYGEIK